MRPRNRSSLRARARLLGLLGLLSLAAVSASGCAVVSRQLRAYTDGPEPAKPADTRTLWARDTRLAALWIGHASVLVRMDDRILLADPVTTNQVGGLSRRLVAPAMTAEELPPGLTVIISHAHFDHLSVGTLTDIQGKVRRAYLPPGAASYLPDVSFDARELGPWKSDEDLGFKVTAVPVLHRGGRYGADSMWNDETFTGYVVEYHGLSVYFGGDTGYDGAAFKTVSERFPSLDLAILPIGPIHPRAFMRSMHEDGYEAVAAFLDLGAKYMLPMHFGTFVNSTDEPGEDLHRFNDAVARANVDPTRASALAPGEARAYVKQGEDRKAAKGAAQDEKKSEASQQEPPAKKSEDDDSRLGD